MGEALAIIGSLVGIGTGIKGLFDDQPSVADTGAGRFIARDIQTPAFSFSNGTLTPRRASAGTPDRTVTTPGVGFSSLQDILSAPRLISGGGENLGVATDQDVFIQNLMDNAALGGGSTFIPGEAPTTGSLQFDLLPMLAGLPAEIAELALGFQQLSERSEDLRPGFEGASGDLGGIREKIDSLFSRFASQRDFFGSKVDPVTGELVSDIEDVFTARRDEAVGSIRDSFARRGILGSSFANDAIARTEQSFAQEESLARNQAIFQSIQAGVNIEQSFGQLAVNLLGMDAAIIGQQVGILGEIIGLNEFQSQQLARQVETIKTQNDVIQGALFRELQELGVAANIANGISAIASENAQFEISRAFEQAEAQGDFLTALPKQLGDLANVFGSSTVSADVAPRPLAPLLGSF